MWAWIKAHRKLIVLKCVVALMMVIAHFYPETIPHLFVNLVWLFVF